jgi:hypothetical protein
MAPASDPKTPFPVRRVDEIAPRSDETRWLVEGLFAASSVGLIGGPPKAFKTWVAAELALAVAAGTPAFGRFATPRAGPVLFFGAEDPLPDLRSRFEGIARARSIDLRHALLLLLDIAELRLDDPRQLDRLRRTVACHAPALLVLDPLVRVARIDENSAQEVSALLGALRTLQREHAVTVLLVHHMRKSPAAHPAQQLRGSGDFSAWADSALYLARRGDDRILIAEHRGAPAPSPFRLRLVPDELPYLAVLDAPGADLGAADALEARILERLSGVAARPQPAGLLRDALRVRKTDLLAALRALAARGVVVKTDLGWTLASAD